MLALDPSERFTVKIGAACFEFRFMTLREFRAAGRLWDANADTPFDAALDDLMDTLRVNLVGWSGVTGRDGRAIPYDPACLEDVVTLSEAWELLGASRAQSRTTSAEKNASGSPSPTASGASAAGAAAAGEPESAPSGPPSPSRPSSTAPAAADMDATSAEIAAR